MSGIPLWMRIVIGCNSKKGLIKVVAVNAKHKKLSMNLNDLTAISPVDGRYRSKTDSLAAYFSELH